MAPGWPVLSQNVHKEHSVLGTDCRQRWSRRHRRLTEEPTPPPFQLMLEKQEE